MSNNVDNMVDIIVIGAGIAGASAAAELAADARVVLVETEAQPGYHATGRSAAYYAPSYGNDVVRNLTCASQNFFYRPPAGFSESPLIRDRQALFIARPDQATSIADMQAENPELLRLSGDELLAHVPVLKREVLAQGLLDAVGGDLDVDAILQGYLRLLRQRGGQLLLQSPVTNLAYANGCWQVQAGQVQLKAPLVINAAGAWADPLANMAGLASLGLVPKRRTALLVDAPADMDIRDWPLVIDVDEQLYFKPDAGQLLVSPADETPSEPMDAWPEELDIAVAIDRLLQVVDLDIKTVNQRWAGLRTFAPDKTFVVGLDPRAEGFFWLAGQGGYGVQSSPGMAHLVRHLILGSAPPADFADVCKSIEAVAPARLLV
jgi:D-arginine dehydrogenase